MSEHQFKIGLMVFFHPRAARSTRQVSLFKLPHGCLQQTMNLNTRSDHPSMGRSSQQVKRNCGRFKRLFVPGGAPRAASADHHFGLHQSSGQ